MKTELETKHTPGPWTVSPSEGAALGPGGKIVASCEGFGFSQEAKSPEEIAANTALVAAAPDLLGMCEWVKWWLEDLEKQSNTVTSHVVKELDKAISKAKGQQ